MLVVRRRYRYHYQPRKRSVFLSAVVLANHPHQLLVGAVVYSSALKFGEIVERGRALARDVYADHPLVSISVRMPKN